MQAKILSLFAKIVAGAMILSAFVMIVFFGKEGIPVYSVIALAAAVAAIFGDITLSIWLDKFLVLFGKKAPEVKVDSENKG